MNATRTQITDLLRQGLSNQAIASQLRCDKHRVGRIRHEERIANVQPQPLTLEEKWEANTQPVDGGHLKWIGERGQCSGTPTMRYREKSYSPTSIAFRMKHGRDPKGYAYAECGYKHCVAPAHVDDETTRMQAREQLRYLTGGAARKPSCVHGHDQVEHGRYESDGTAYCNACKVIARRKAVRKLHARHTPAA